MIIIFCVGGQSALEALLAGGAANFHQMLDMSHADDADDEAMVELAIALSLQASIVTVTSIYPSSVSVELMGVSARSGRVLKYFGGKYLVT